MPDREKVIKGLKACVGRPHDCAGGKCPYFDTDECRIMLEKDALELLKEQERKKGSWDYGTQCSVCKGTIIPPQDRKIRVNFCPWCGADMRDSYK